MDGVIRRGAKLLYAYAEATVPLVTVITRKAYGGAYIVMGSKQLGADINFAWPTGRDRGDGRPGRGQHPLPQRDRARPSRPATSRSRRARTLANEYTYNVATPFLAAERGDLDGVIDPHETRSAIVKVAAAAALQARDPAAEEAREHPAVSENERPASAASVGGSDHDSAPLLRVVNPDATAEEVAALVAVFAALGSAGGEPPRRRAPEWSAPHRRVRRTHGAGHPSGPAGWRSSGLPR